MTKPLLASKRDLVALLAYWGIKQSPYTLPDDLVSVLQQFEEGLDAQWDSNAICGIMAFTRDSLGEIMRSALMMIPEFVDWNLSAAEKAKGVKVDDETRKPFLFMSRYGQPIPEHDFIDLDALIRNICNSAERDQV
jgi:hypothetical protein